MKIITKIPLLPAVSVDEDTYSIGGGKWFGCENEKGTMDILIEEDDGREVVDELKTYLNQYNIKFIETDPNEDPGMYHILVPMEMFEIQSH